MKVITTVVFLSFLAGAGALAEACTGLYAFRDGLALAGNNEDYWDPDTRMWFVPAEDGAYGRVYFGFGNGYPQGGMNQAGLFFDGFATGRVEVKNWGGKERHEGVLVDEAMARCATVEEVVALFERYDLRLMERFMLFFGDRHGGSVIIEGDAFVRGDGRSQVVTNFYQSLTDPSQYTCRRYRIASAALGGSEEISVDLFRRTLAAVHMELTSPTQYSNVCDLTNGIVYLYHFHNYEDVVVVNLEEELKKGAREVEIPSLFSETYAFPMFEDWREGELVRKKVRRDAVDLEPEVLDEYVGRYEMQIPGWGQWDVRIYRRGRRLFCRTPDGDVTEMVPEGDERFFLIDYDGAARCIFSHGEDGDVTQYVYERGEKRYVGTKVR